MRRIILILLAGLSLTACAPVPNGEKVVVNGNTYYREEGKYYFRDSIWGMTIDDVGTLEGREPSSELDIGTVISVGYDDVKVNNMRANAYYYFESKTGELYSGYYSFVERNYNGDVYLEMFDTLEKALVELYGEPVKVSDIISDEYTEWSKDEYGKALMKGQLSFSHVWESGDTGIELSVKYGGLAEADLRLSYYDILKKETLGEAAKEKRQKQAEQEKKREDVLKRELREQAEEIEKQNRKDTNGL